MESEYPWLGQYKLNMESSNTFPHSTGIASSASAMSALALCVQSLDYELRREETGDAEFYKRASYLSRLGSGSACRSIYPTLAVWGASDDVPESSNKFAVDVSAEVHLVFTDYRDSILIVSSAEKSVSSRAGHALMDRNPFAGTRYQIAHRNLGYLLEAMQRGDMHVFIKIVEEEALMLHALMMTSEPSYVLIRPNTLAIIEKIRSFRSESGVPVCFTLDAGPNVHVLFPAINEESVKDWMQSDLLDLCEGGRIIHDMVGKGPERLI